MWTFEAFVWLGGVIKQQVVIGVEESFILGSQTCHLWVEIWGMGFGTLLILLRGKFFTCLDVAKKNCHHEDGNFRKRARNSFLPSARDKGWIRYLDT